jgi:fasciclin domain-containing protein
VALSGKSPFTLFAPTDEAFSKLPDGTVETLPRPENVAKLAAVMKFHVVQVRVYSAAALAVGKAITLQGDSVKIAVNGRVAMVNGVKLSEALGELTNHTSRYDFRAITPAQTKILLVEGTSRLLPTYAACLGQEAVCSLKRLRVSVRMDTRLITEGAGERPDDADVRTLPNEPRHSVDEIPQPSELRHTV